MILIDSGCHPKMIKSTINKTNVNAAARTLKSQCDFFKTPTTMKQAIIKPKIHIKTIVVLLFS